MLTELAVRSQEFPIVGKLGDMFSSTMKAVAVAFFTGALILIVILLVWSHISDRESGKWWKALAVWVIAVPLTAGGTALYNWSASNLTI